MEEISLSYSAIADRCDPLEPAVILDVLSKVLAAPDAAIGKVRRTLRATDLQLIHFQSSRGRIERPDQFADQRLDPRGLVEIGMGN